MTETVRYTKIFAEDIAFGTSTQNVELQGGEVVALSELNLAHFHDSNDNVLYASSDGTTDDVFNYDAANDRLFVPEIAGGTGSGDDVRIKGTTHATPGSVTLNEDGGNVGIGIDTPTELLHLNGSGTTVLINESSTGDPQVLFELASVATFVMGVDNSDSDKFKLDNGGTLGANNDFVLTAAGLVGLGTSTPEASLHVFTSNSTVTPEVDADEIFVEASGDAGITIGSGTTSNSTLRFSRSTLATAGSVSYDHNNEVMLFSTNGSEVMRLESRGSLLLGASTESSFLGDSSIQVDSNGNGAHAIILQESDTIAHGMTQVSDTTTYGYIQYADSSSGGLKIAGLSETTNGMILQGNITTEETSDSDSSRGAVEVVGALKSGTSITALGDTGNVFSVRNNSTTVFIVNGDGDVSNSGGSTAMTTYDDYDDTKLLKAFKGVMDNDYRNKLGEWVDEHTAILERGGIITRGESGRWFISQRGLRGLIIDAIGQLDSRLRALESPGA